MNHIHCLVHTGPGHLITVHRERRGSSASDCVQCKDTTSDSNNNNGKLVYSQ